jgi:formamidopyrimidine-DNA glycosylase
MLELPEAVVISGQMNQVLSGKCIDQVIANQNPHKFAWFTGDPALYNFILAGRHFGSAHPLGPNVEIEAGDRRLVLGGNLRYHAPGAKRPAKHQLFFEFEDGSALTASVQMWGCMFCLPEGDDGNWSEIYHARRRPMALTEEFNRPYFDTLFDENTPKLPVKTFLATQQRIPGLGNGVLQDILWTARLHPKRKMADLASAEIDALFSAIKSTLQSMVDNGGRDTEGDLFDQPGRYRTLMSKLTVGLHCPVCSSTIRKESYLGGSIYFCPTCQEI